MKFGVVVVSHDSAADLTRLLASLSCLPVAPELVVVETGLGEGVEELAVSAGAVFLSRTDNPGFGVANNVGVAAVRSDVCCLLNPDVGLLDAGLLSLVSRASSRDALLAPRLLNPDGSVQRTAHPLPGTVGSLLPAVVHPPLLPRPVRDRVEPWRSDRPRTVGWVIAAALVARTALLRRLGPFDPDAFLFYEDMDLCLRARAAGIPTELHPEVALRHTGAHSTNRAFAGEPHELLARRRREVIRARLGPRALRLDDTAQALTFATRALAHPTSTRERAQLRALRAEWNQLDGI